jgi:serine/threonine protein kinase
VTSTHAFVPLAHERRVARRLEARGDPGLGEILSRLGGTEIEGRWRIERLYAVGAEGAVYLARDLADPSAPPRAVKIPLLPLHRPAQLSSSVVRKQRAALREEAANLERSASPYMPAPLAVAEFVNPLLDARRGGAFVEPEPALVMERLGGIDVDRWLSRVHASRVPRDLLRSHVDQVAVVLLHALEDIHARGFIDADLRPANLRVIAHPARRVRLVDAGSLVEIGDRSGKFPHAPHYLPPALFGVRHGMGLPIVPDAAVQAVMAGRTLYEIATGSVPVPGEPIPRERMKALCMSPAVADVVDGLASGSFDSARHAIRYLSRGAARRSAPGPTRDERPAPAPAAPSRAPTLADAARAWAAAPPAPPRRGLLARLRSLFRRA